MRRLARRLFMVCSAVSLLLCVAVCVLWVRSYSNWDRAVHSSVTRGDVLAVRQVDAETLCGVLCLTAMNCRTTSGWYREVEANPDLVQADEYPSLELVIPFEETGLYP